MGKVKKASYKKKWGGADGDAPAAPAVVATTEPAPAAAKPSIFGNLNPLAAVAGLGTKIQNTVTTGLTSAEEGAKNLTAKGEGVLGDAKDKISGNVAALTAKFEAVKDAVAGPAPAPVAQPGGGKRRRTRKRTAKRKTHKRKRTHKQKKKRSHKRRK